MNNVHTTLTSCHRQVVGLYGCVLCDNWLLHRQMKSAEAKYFSITISVAVIQLLHCFANATHNNIIYLGNRKLLDLSLLLLQLTYFIWTVDHLAQGSWVRMDTRQIEKFLKTFMVISCMLNNNNVTMYKGISLISKPQPLLNRLGTCFEQSKHLQNSMQIQVWLCKRNTVIWEIFV